jgi:hypothetical protein
MLEAFQFDETMSLAITYGCLAGAVFLQVYSRLDGWSRWKFRVKTRFLEIFGQA